MQIEREPSPSPDTLAAVRAGMRRHAEAFVPWEEYADLAIVARAADAALAGAALGEAGRGWLHVSAVWVDEVFRRQGVGRRLLQAMEQGAVRRGCRGAYLDTFGYQAPRSTRSSARRCSARSTTTPPATSGFSCASGWSS